MGFQVSPGVQVSEIDLTTIVPAVSSTVGAIAGVFEWGPVMERRLVTSESDLVAQFGKSTSDNYETFLTASSFLAYANSLQVVRAASANAFNAVAMANTEATPSSSLQIKNAEHYDTVSTEASVVYYAKCPGVKGNSLKVSVCDSINAYSKAINLNGAGVSLGLTVGSNTAFFTGADANTVQVVLDDLAIGDVIEVGNTTLGTQYLRISSISAASTNTSVIFDSKYYLAEDHIETQEVVRYWEYNSLVDSAPGTSTYTSGKGGQGDEVHVVVVDEDGLFTGAPGTVLEVWEGLSRATDARGEQGGSNYYVDVINNQSQFLFWSQHRAGAPATTAATSASATTDRAYTASLGAGTNGLAESSIELNKMIQAYDLFRSAESVDVSLILTGKSIHGASRMDLANYIIENICEFRKDCIAVVSPPLEDVNNVPYVEASNVVSRRTIHLPSSSYAVMDSGYKYMYDRYNDLYRWVPLNGDVAGLMVQTDNLRDPWFSPAGFNRGFIKNAAKLAFNPNKAERDLLYKNGINPVVTFPGQGTVLYGDKTLLSKPSAFDRINVRRLFIVLEKAIATASQFTLFEFNDAFTRAQFRNLVEPFLRDVQGRRGIYDFRVVCDETNNTGEIIDRNEFIGDIYIKPARSINFIQLNFVAVRTGVEFEEVVGQF